MTAATVLVLSSVQAGLAGADKPPRLSPAALERHRENGRLLHALIIGDQPAGPNAFDLVEPIRMSLMAAESAVWERVGGGAPLPERPLFDPLFTSEGGDAEELAWARDAVEACIASGVYERIDEFARRERFEPPIWEGPLFLRPMPWIGTMRWMARALAARARVEGDRGRHNEVARCVEGLQGIAAHAARERVVIGRLVAEAMRRLAFGTVVWWLASCRPDGAALATMAGILADAPEMPPRAEVVEAERLFVLDARDVVVLSGPGLWHELTTPTTGLNKIDPPPIRIDGQSPYAWNIDRLQSLADEYFEGLENWLETPPHARSSLGFDPDLRAEHMKQECVLLPILLPAWGRAARVMDEGSLHHAMLPALLAIHQHQRRHGSWPSALAEIDPEFRTPLPVDPYDGGPLKYVRGAEEFDGFVLYSVGRDGDDDGGVPMHEGDGDLILMDARTRPGAGSG